MAPAIDRERVSELVAAGAQLLDVLPAEDYEARHLVGARNLPLKELDAKAAAGIDRGRPVIVYCNDFQ
jgi:rhodanese-related sulfurtransferase